MSARPRSVSPRLLAWRILERWSPDGIFADELVARAAERDALSAPNRALLQALVFGVLRNRSLLDLWIDHLRGGGPLDDAARHWLQLGLVQGMIMNLPGHAAVNETVELAGRAKGLVNAVLRRALRERATLERMRQEAPPHIRWSLPEFLTARWARRFGDGVVEALGEWCGRPAPVIVRANGLMPGAAAAVEADRDRRPLEAFPGFFECDSLPRRELAAGQCYAQDPSTAVAPQLLAPVPGQNVLDACAAPGGKCAILAELMENDGRLTATDCSANRTLRLRDNLQRMGVRIAHCLVHDWEDQPSPPEGIPESFDRILLDAPCSNTGVLRRRVDLRWRIAPEFISAVAERQRKLLTHLLPLLRPGGRLVYSTCSIEHDENGAVVSAVLRELPGYRQLQTRATLPHVDGVDGGWASLIERTAE